MAEEVVVRAAGVAVLAAAAHALGARPVAPQRIRVERRHRAIVRRVVAQEVPERRLLALAHHAQRAARVLALGVHRPPRAQQLERAVDVAPHQVAGARRVRAPPRVGVREHRRLRRRADAAAAVRVRVDRAEAVEHAEAGVRLVHRRVRVERRDDAPPGHQRRRDDHQPAPRRQPARRAPGRPAARRRQHRVHKVVAVDVGVERRRQRRLHPVRRVARRHRRPRVRHQHERAVATVVVGGRCSGVLSQRVRKPGARWH